MSTPKQLNGTNREDVENFNSPMENQLLDHSMEVTDHSADGDGGKKVAFLGLIKIGIIKKS